MISTALALLETDEQRNVLSEFYQKYKNRFYAIAYSKLHGKAAAEDAVQEAFLRIVDKPENFFKIEHNKRVAYADVIVRNVAIDMFNKNNAHKIEELWIYSYHLPLQTISTRHGFLTGLSTMPHISLSSSSW